MRHLAGLSLLLSAVVAVPVLPVQALQPMAPAGDSGNSGNSDTLVARKGGGGGGGGARRSGGGGGGGVRRSSGGGGPSRSRTGFSGASGGLNRGSSPPSGGWSQRAASGRATPTLNRPSSSANRNLNRDGNRNLNRDANRTFDRNVNRNIDRNLDRNVNRNVNRDVNWNRRVNINNVNINTGWARPGWGYARPWNTGWYSGWRSPSWGWWGANAAAWGITGLATAAIINSAVDNAVDSNTTYIVVPNTSYELLYGSVQPSGSSGVSFAVTADGSTYQLSADCNSGTLDGRPPTTAEEAELLNAACQVAFGAV